MTPKQREKFYDKEVAPVLFDLAEKCLANGLQFVSAVEWDRERMTDGGWGKTIGAEPGEASCALYMIYVAAKAGGNFDWFMRGMRQYIKEHGPGNSMEAYLMSCQAAKDSQP